MSLVAKRKKTAKPPKRNQATLDLLESMQELQGYLDKGMTAQDIKEHYRKNFPDRIREYTKTGGKWIRTDPSVKIGEPGRYSAKSLRALRVKLALSQAVFAKSLGVSAILVQSWERGVREPSPLARRLLDVINRDPGSWLASVAPSIPAKTRRAG